LPRSKANVNEDLAFTQSSEPTDRGPLGAVREQVNRRDRIFSCSDSLARASRAARSDVDWRNCARVRRRMRSGSADLVAIVSRRTRRMRVCSMIFAGGRARDPGRSAIAAALDARACANSVRTCETWAARSAARWSASSCMSSITVCKSTATHARDRRTPIRDAQFG
jgi:hypothetical protein